RPTETAAAPRVARRTELLDAAIAAIRREGPGASMEMIAAEAGVTKPVIYKHFGHREGLAKAIADRFAADLEAALLEALSGNLEGRELLAATIDAYLAFVEQDPNVYRFLLHRVSQHPEASSSLSGLIPRIGQQIALVLGEQLRDEGRDSGAAEPWAYGIIGMVHVASDWWLARRTMPRARMVQYLSELLWEGVSMMPAASHMAASTEEVVRGLRSAAG
ncbi:MAG: TetR family transcriptional regulator, partial [Acidimicrobiales bacterium]